MSSLAMLKTSGQCLHWNNNWSLSLQRVASRALVVIKLLLKLTRTPGWRSFLKSLERAFLCTSRNPSPGQCCNCSVTILFLLVSNHSATLPCRGWWWKTAWQRDLPSWCWIQEQDRTGRWIQVWALRGRSRRPPASSPSWGCWAGRPRLGSNI